MHFANCCLGLAIPVNCSFLGGDGKLPRTQSIKVLRYILKQFLCAFQLPPIHISSWNDSVNFNHKRRRVQHLAYWSTSLFFGPPSKHIENFRLSSIELYRKHFVEVERKTCHHAIIV